MAVMAMRLHLFDGVTGAHVRRLSASKVTWSDSINECGSINAEVPAPRDSEGMFSAYRYIIAACDGMNVRHAGYITHAKYDQKDSIWSIDGGGALSVLDRRLVINYALASAWKDGTVIVDEDNPKGNWPLKLTGCYSDIISRLIRETLKWGTLPIVPAAIKGGNKERNYNSYDLATIADRIGDIGDLENGPETRFDPSLDGSWNLTFKQVSSDDGGELVNRHWKWNALIPDSGVTLDDVDIDGSEMCTQSFGVGGRDEDKLLVARASSSALLQAGWPVLQIANKEHSSVSELATLQGYVRADVSAGDDPQKVEQLRVSRARYDVRVGDWADVRFGRDDRDVMYLKITDVSGSLESDMLTLQARHR